MLADDAGFHFDMNTVVFVDAAGDQRGSMKNVLTGTTMIDQNEGLSLVYRNRAN